MKAWKINPQDVFNASPVVPVMVIERVEDAVPMARALLAGGIRVFEITLRTPIALEAIRQIVKAMPDAMVGAGTVLNCQQYDAAVAAGAKFVISPGMTAALLAHAKKGEAPLIPGVSSASEIMQALECGYQQLKFFPAEANGGAKALAAISAPLPSVSFCPTGGINPSNVAQYTALPCVATVGGSWMLPKEAIDNGQWDIITTLSSDAIALLV